MILIPNCEPRVSRPDNARWQNGKRYEDDIYYLLAHATIGGGYASSSVPYMNRDLDDPKGPMKKVGYHYGIERNGAIVRTCDPLIVVPHAGDSAWPNPIHWSKGGNNRSINFRSVGIAFALLEGEKVSEMQADSGLWLFTTLMRRFHLAPSNVLGHKEVSPGRKFDPDTLDMDLFRRQLAEVKLAA